MKVEKGGAEEACKRGDEQAVNGGCVMGKRAVKKGAQNAVENATQNVAVGEGVGKPVSKSVGKPVATGKVRSARGRKSAPLAGRSVEEVEPRALLRVPGLHQDERAAVTIALVRGGALGKVSPFTALNVAEIISPITWRQKMRRKPNPNKRLSPRERKFVELMLEMDGKITATDAARMAGYPKTRAALEAKELLNPNLNPHVAKVFRAAQEEQRERVTVTRYRHLRDLQEIRDKALDAGSFSAAVQAEYRRGQASEEPIYVQRSEVRTGTLESMTAEEIRRELERLRKEYQDGSLEGTSERVYEPLAIEEKASDALEFDCEALPGDEVYLGIGSDEIVAQEQSESVLEHEGEKKPDHSGSGKIEEHEWLE